VGLIREGNEDALYAGPRLLAVADGMGGHAAGEVASRVVIESLVPLDASPPDGDLTEAMRRAVVTANGYLRDMAAADGALEGMGTTLTALVWVNQQLGLVHIGDSRAYLLRDGELQQVTHDHTLVQSLIDQGRITPDEATTHPQRSWITNALDGRPDIVLDLSLRDVRAGDRYLVCSDGLSSYVSEQTIAEALRTGDPQAACDQLVDLALRSGGLDNVTCIVADLVDDDGAGPGPIVGGAAAVAAAADPRADSPAARAAAIQPRPRASTPPLQPGAEPGGAEPAADRLRGSRRVGYVLAAVVVLVIAGVAATLLYARTQFYVGAAQGSTPTVGVYRGVEGSVAGLDLSRLSDRTDLPVSALPNSFRDQVSSGMQASSHDDARRIVARLRSAACATVTPPALPSPQPSTKASSQPSAQASAQASPGTGTHRRHRAGSTPTPSPSPIPSYCAVSP
jgi:protein phosphatase